MRQYRIFLIFICLLGFQFSANAQRETFSYIYIQGDKEIPFYVKFEDEMLPRYGKNYSIISELAPGPVNIQILFQQNVYKPIKFVIQVPENGFRGFLLTKKGEEFSLYDIQQKFYLPAGNKADEDRLPGTAATLKEPEATAITAPVPTPEPVPRPVIAKQPKPAKTKPQPKPIPEIVVEEIPRAPKKSKKEPAQVAEEPVAEKPAKKVKKEPEVEIVRVPAPPPPSPKAETPAPAKSGDPRFIDDIALKNERSNAANSRIEKPKKATGMTVVNSDCPSELEDMAFLSIQRKARERVGEDKLKYLMGQMDNCYSTAQMRILARTVETDAERFTLLKRAYARVTDQGSFHVLESEFTESEWKEHFRSLTNK